MLVHHFGSKEKLIGAVMSELHGRLQSIFDTLAKNAGKKRAPDLMLIFWQSIIRRENLKYVRLLLEVQILAIQNPRRYRRYLTAASSSWLRLITHALPSGRSRKVMATLSTAVIDGLMLEFLSTGDKSRTSQALRLFATRFGHKS
jgi:AcrR family transcriptional regulator